MPSLVEIDVVTINEEKGFIPRCYNFVLVIVAVNFALDGFVIILVDATGGGGGIDVAAAVASSTAVVARFLLPVILSSTVAISSIFVRPLLSIQFGYHW